MYDTDHLIHRLNPAAVVWNLVVQRPEHVATLQQHRDLRQQTLIVPILLVKAATKTNNQERLHIHQVCTC